MLLTFLGYKLELILGNAPGVLTMKNILCLTLLLAGFSGFSHALSLPKGDKIDDSLVESSKKDSYGACQYRFKTEVELETPLGKKLVIGADFDEDNILSALYFSPGRSIITSAGSFPLSKAVFAKENQKVFLEHLILWAPVKILTPLGELTAGQNDIIRFTIDQNISSLEIAHSSIRPLSSRLGVIKIRGSSIALIKSNSDEKEFRLTLAEPASIKTPMGNLTFSDYLFLTSEGLVYSGHLLSPQTIQTPLGQASVTRVSMSPDGKELIQFMLSQPQILNTPWGPLTLEDEVTLTAPGSRLYKGYIASTEELRLPFGNIKTHGLFRIETTERFLTLTQPQTIPTPFGPQMVQGFLGLTKNNALSSFTPSGELLLDTPLGKITAMPKSISLYPDGKLRGFTPKENITIQSPIGPLILEQEIDGQKSLSFFQSGKLRSCIIKEPLTLKLAAGTFAIKGSLSFYESGALSFAQLEKPSLLKSPMGLLYIGNFAEFFENGLLKKGELISAARIGRAQYQVGSIIEFGPEGKPMAISNNLEK